MRLSDGEPIPSLFTGRFTRLTPLASNRVWTSGRVDRGSASAMFRRARHSGGSVEIGDELRRVDADGLREVEELHDVNPPFAPFNPRDVGLPPIQPVSQGRLGQLRVLPRLRQQFP